MREGRARIERDNQEESAEEMSNQNYQPRPTEYSGVVFRSKTEAKFARTLTNLLDVSITYEPSYMSPEADPYLLPDFVWEMEAPASGQDLLIVAECKPSPPTNTFLSEYFNKKTKFWEGLQLESYIYPVVWVHDFYSGKHEASLHTMKRYRDYHFGEKWSFYSLFDCTAMEYRRAAKEAAKYRFDLKQ